MGNVVIVAIPREDDLVWDISSEKVPHMTICFLGDESNVKNFSSIVEFLGHAAETSLERFYMTVDKRGTLGPDQADVLFFDKGWEFPAVKEFRSFLLMDNNIKTAVDSAPQYPEWTPHLTLGYPKAPAAELDKGQRIYDVCFDRVAIWTGDFEGPEFDLKTHKFMEVSMSSVIDDILSHHGVKGMKWGRRKAAGSPPGPASVVVTTKTSPKSKTKISTSGGTAHPAHPDAVAAKTTQQILKKSGSHALSTQELQDLQTRLNLESNVSRLDAQQRAAGQHFAVRFIKDPAGRRKIKDAADSPQGQAVKKSLKKKLATAAATAALAA